MFTTGFLILLLGAGLVGYSLYSLRKLVGDKALKASTVDEQRLQEMADELLAAAEDAARAVDEKVGQLEALMGMVEGRVARLQHTAAEHQPRAAGNDLPEPAVVANDDASMSRNRAKAWAVLQGSGSAGRVAGVGRGSAQAERDSLLGPMPQLEETKGHTNRRIYQLFDQGYDVTHIAKQVGLTKGEVQLILSLREMR